MGSFRRIAATAVLATGVMFAFAPAASADGGAYVWFEKTYHLPGTSTEAYASVYVPEKKSEIIDRGPFFLYVITGGRPIREGRPIPAGAIRLGMFSIHEKKGWYEFETGFTVPDLPGDFYTVMVCNDPCTIAGFREPLIGQIGIVATLREERLLKQQGLMKGRLRTAARHLRESERRVGDLQAIVDLRQLERTRLIADVGRLREDLAQLRRSVRASTRPLVSAAVGWTIAGGLVAIAAVLLFRPRRSVRVVVPNDAAELDVDGTLDRERERARTR